MRRARAATAVGALPAQRAGQDSFHGLHDRYAFGQWHDRTLEDAGSEAPSHFVRLVVEPAATAGTLEPGGCAAPGHHGEARPGVEARVDVDPGFGPDDRGTARTRGTRRAVEEGVGTPVEAQEYGRLSVHAGEGRLHHGEDPVRRSQDHGRKRDGIDAEVEQGTS